MSQNYLRELDRSSTLSALPHYDCSVSKNAPGREIAAHFDKTPALPGVVVLDYPDRAVLLSRNVFHEVLGKPYGIDLFLHRPIKVLIATIEIQLSTILHEATTIHEAARIILNREPENTYEPIIVKFNEGSLCVIDAYDILAAQNHLLGIFNEELDTNQKISEALRASGFELSKSLNFEEILDKIMKHVNSLVECDATCLFIAHDDVFNLVRTNGSNNDEIQKLVDAQSRLIKEFLHKIEIEPDEPTFLSINKDTPTYSLLGVPMLEKAEVIGILFLKKKTKHQFRNTELTTIFSYANHASSALMNARYHESIRQLAVSDSLTGLLNRHGFYLPAQQIVQNLKCTGSHLSIMMVDLDHFKSINDQFGHVFGDKVLIKISEIITSSTRTTDYSCRYGGDEFLILLPNTDVNEAGNLGKRILSRVDELNFFHGATSIHPKVSIGISSYKNIEENNPKVILEKMIERVDFALYQAKLSGRHCIFTWLNEVAPIELPQTEPEIELLLESLTRTQAELQASKAMTREISNHLDIILENAGEAILLVDSRSNIVIFNKSAQITFGYQSEKIMGKSIDILFPRQSGLIRRKAESEQENKGNNIFTGKRKSGESFPVEICLSTVEFNNVSYMILICSDITERINNQKEIISKNKALKDAYFQTIFGWSQALELRDMETLGHSKRVTIITLRLAKELGVPEEEWENIQRGALLHDIGKMAIPDHVLSKSGPLTEDEWEIMRKHPSIAHDLLSHIEFLQPAIDIPTYHHEKWDGSGYPYGLSGKEIPLSARIFAIGDVWDALRSDRTYRKAMSEDQARLILAKRYETHFDPSVYKAFIRLLNQGYFDFYTDEGYNNTAEIEQIFQAHTV
jgi:diguanylate cyclase (GGDEF)-like protein/PAS domain S-box-containing protein/putative nucleotidyltransferase with HDIG domain